MRRKYNNKLEAGNLKQKTVVCGLKFAGGQSLIEVLVAFTVSIIVGMALVSAGLATQRASISARNKSQATKLAQEYLEQIRLIRDVKGYSTLFPSGFTDGCYSLTISGTDPSAWSLSGRIGAACTSTNGENITLNNTIFNRKVTFSNGVSANSKKVVVDVNWTEGVNTRTVSEETTFSKWYEGGI